MRSKTDFAVFVLAAFLVVSLFLAIASAIEPNGASISAGTPERAPTDTAGQNEAWAGNVTELTVTGTATTQTWQGYFGNVTGSIQLADASDNVLYNWSLANPSGEVYASTNSTVSWTNIQCLNFTATGTGGDESGNGGTTNLNGTNLTALESQFNIGSTDADGVDETFSEANSHVEFFTANQQFSAGECASADIFDSNQESTDGNFEEVLLYEPSTFSVIFASIIESGTTNGFDSNDHDFEMLVLEDGHGSNVLSTTYYFFVELE